jgi:hypothetical protein
MKLQVHAHVIIVGLIFVKMIGVTSIMTDINIPTPIILGGKYG